MPSWSFARCTCAIDAEPKAPGLEIAEHLERRAPERAFQVRQQLLEGNRRDFAVQPLELGDPTRGE